MKICKLEKVFLSAVSMILVGFCVLGLVDFVVFSQYKKADVKMSKKKSDDDKDGYQIYIDTLRKNQLTKSDSEKIVAIKKLGDSGISRAIPVLIEYLDFEDVSLRNKKTVGIDVTEQNDVYISEKYPSVGALIQIGAEALPFLVDVIENEKLDSLRNKNARQTLQYIFLKRNLTEAVLFLQKEASKSQTINGKQNLLKAANEISVLQEKTGI